MRYLQRILSFALLVPSLLGACGDPPAAVETDSIEASLTASELVHLAFDPTSRYVAVSAAMRQTIVVDLYASDSAIEGNREYQRMLLEGSGQ